MEKDYNLQKDMTSFGQPFGVRGETFGKPMVDPALNTAILRGRADKISGVDFHSLLNGRPLQPFTQDNEISGRGL